MVNYFLKIGRVIYTIFTGACDLYRVRGFQMKSDGSPDLEKEVYVGDWKSLDLAKNEIENLIPY